MPVIVPVSSAPAARAASSDWSRWAGVGLNPAAAPAPVELRCRDDAVAHVDELLRSRLVLVPLALPARHGRPNAVMPLRRRLVTGFQTMSGSTSDMLAGSGSTKRSTTHLRTISTFSCDIAHAVSLDGVLLSMQSGAFAVHLERALLSGPPSPNKIREGTRLRATQGQQTGRGPDERRRAPVPAIESKPEPRRAPPNTVCGLRNRRSQVRILSSLARAWSVRPLRAGRLLPGPLAGWHPDLNRGALGIGGAALAGSPLPERVHPGRGSWRHVRFGDRLAVVG